MDMFDIRALYTVAMFLAFVGIVLWAWSARRRDDFSEAANLPFNEPEYPEIDDGKEGRHE